MSVCMGPGAPGGGCELLTLVVMGDPTLIKNGLQAVSIIFGSGGLFDTTGGGLNFGPIAALPILISLIGIVTSAISSQKLRVDYLLVVTIIYGVLYVPKMPIAIYDIYTGGASGDHVEDVPVGLAVIASATSMGAYEITAELSQFLAGVDSKHSEFHKDGFIHPFRVLLAARNFSEMYMENPVTSKNSHNYWQYCIVPKIRTGAFELKELDKRSGDAAMEYLFSNPALTGQTFYIDGTGDEVVANCSTVGPDLRVRFEALINGATDAKDSLNGYVVGRMGTQIGRQQIDVDAAMDKVSEMATAVADAAAFKKTLFAYNYAQSARKFEGLTSSQSVTYTQIMTDTIESDKAQSAVEGETFLNYMIPAMSMFQFLFYVFSPVMGVIILATGPNSLKIAGGYLMFGVWAHSWLPVAAMINFWIEGTVSDALVNAKTGINYYGSVGGVGDLYTIVSNYVALGSKVLAATPMITFALLTGSPYAVSQIAGSLGGGGKPDTSTASPNLHHADSMLTTSPAKTQTFAESELGNAPILLGMSERYAYDATSKSVVQAGMSAAIERSVTASSTAGHSVKEIGSIIRSGGGSISGGIAQIGGQQVNLDKTRENAVREQSSETFGTRLTKSESKALSAAAKAGFEAFGNGVEFRAAVDQVRGMLETAGFDSSKAEEFLAGTVSRFTNSLSEQVKGDKTVGYEAKNAFGQAAEDTKSWASEARNARKYSDTYQRLNESGFSASFKTSDLAQRHLNGQNNGAMAATRSSEFAQARAALLAGGTPEGDVNALMEAAQERGNRLSQYHPDPNVAIPSQLQGLYDAMAVEANQGNAAARDFLQQRAESAGFAGDSTTARDVDGSINGIRGSIDRNPRFDTAGNVRDTTGMDSVLFQAGQGVEAAKSAATHMNTPITSDIAQLAEDLSSGLRGKGVAVSPDRMAAFLANNHDKFDKSVLGVASTGVYGKAGVMRPDADAFNTIAVDYANTGNADSADRSSRFLLDQMANRMATQGDGVTGFRGIAAYESERAQGGSPIKALASAFDVMGGRYSGMTTASTLLLDGMSGEGGLSVLDGAAGGVLAGAKGYEKMAEKGASALTRAPGSASTVAGGAKLAKGVSLLTLGADLAAGTAVQAYADYQDDLGTNAAMVKSLESLIEKLPVDEREKYTAFKQNVMDGLDTIDVSPEEAYYNQARPSAIIEAIPSLTKSNVSNTDSGASFSDQLRGTRMEGNAAVDMYLRTH